MAYSLSNKCAKNLCKRTVLVQLISENMVTCFFETGCTLAPRAIDSSACAYVTVKYSCILILSTGIMCTRSGLLVVEDDVRCPDLSHGNSHCVDACVVVWIPRQQHVQPRLYSHTSATTESNQY